MRSLEKVYEMKISVELDYGRYHFLYDPGNLNEHISCNVEDKWGEITSYEFKSQKHALACLIDKVAEASKKNREVKWKI